jgi:hypothetical protein
MVTGRRKFGEERSCQRDEKGEITGLAVEEFVGIVPIKMQRKIENEAEGDRRMIKTYEPKEDGGAAERLYLFDQDRLLAILTYDGYSDPERVIGTKRFDAKEVLQESLRFADADDPEKVTSRETYKYELDSQGNWTSRATHSNFRDNPNTIMRRVTRAVKYRGG